MLVLAVPAFGTVSQQAAAIATADAAYSAALTKVPNGPGKANGVAVGRAAAAAIVSLRKDDGAIKDAPYAPGSAPGQWRPHPNPVPADPPIASPSLAFGYGASLLPGWGSVTPFTLLSGAQFRPAGPPPLTSEAYTRDFNEVSGIGGKNSPARTPEGSGSRRSTRPTRGGRVQTVTTTLSPMGDRFVIGVGGEMSAEARAELAAAGSVETVLDDGLIVLRLADTNRDAKAAWERLRAVVGTKVWVAPVLVDATQQAHYPTGDVTIRFARDLSDAELETFAREHGLRVKARNAYVPQQVTLAPLDAQATYLPELVERLRQAGAVRAAWASTRSAYRRLGQP